MSAQYETITLGISDLNRIALPKFQRGFVWSDQKKNEFVDTLHKGFPFGALLVYPESNDPKSKLLLLDGQQRLSTIRQYSENPLKFWKPNNRDEYRSYFDKIDNTIKQLSGEIATPFTEGTLDDLITKKIDEADWADDIAPDDKDARSELRGTIKEIREVVNSYVNLEDLGILAIKFTGNKEHIADVFANLNKGGMPLSKYEIFSAAWVNEEINLLAQGESKYQDEILENVKAYYNRMSQNAEFELNNFSEDELSQTRSITLSEFGIALGMFVQKRLSSLISDTPASVNEIGFGLLGVAMGLDNRSLSALNEQLPEIRRSIEVILERANTICTNLQDIFTKLLKRICATKNDEYANGLSSTFKTLSYFAALWDYDPSSNDYKLSLENIRTYYVYDHWTKVWTSHGDQRLFDYYPANKKRSYLKPLTVDALEDAYSRWSADITPSINFTNEVKALVTIHANLTYLAGTIPSGESFELEHIIAKKHLNAAEDPTNRRIFGGSLGNCMYLPKLVNNKKKDKSLYETGKAAQYDELIQKSHYFNSDDFELIYLYLEEKDYDAVNSYIVKRGQAVAEDLIKSLLKGLVEI